MPRITTIDEARELVGRTFERDGKRRTVIEVTPLGAGFNVMWAFPGSESLRVSWCTTFMNWIGNATEVHE